MESRTHAAREEAARQDELRRQIAALQAQLTTDVPPPPPPPPETPRKRKHGAARIIAAGTPSPKKRKLDAQPPATRRQPAKPAAAAVQGSKTTAMGSKAAGPAERRPLAPSKLLSNLASLQASSKELSVEPSAAAARSASFAEQAPASAPAPDPMPRCQQERDDRLALVEDLLPGPVDHKAPASDPDFARLEPYSGIRLSSRKLPHAELQEHMLGRYFLSPSLMYSVIRPLPSNQGYDVPVPGDWITIAVIAERGPIKWTSSSISPDHDDDGDEQPAAAAAARGRKGKQTGGASGGERESGRKKYMSLKLVDFGTPTASSSSSGARQVRGDALLTLLLFEADSHASIEDETRPKGSKAEKMKVYKGGSGGAFEACMKLHEGAVIAILNPRILKPYQRNAAAPHPTINILAITPTSAESIAIIGRARDLGICAATKRDGKPCGSWCDTRISECCEYHVESAIKRNRAGRPEFSIGTSGMNKTAQVRKPKPAFDPDRKWGLLPTANGGVSRTSSGEGGSAATTYVMSGHVISASGPEYVGERIGRGREERAKRRREADEAEKALSRLLGQESVVGNGDPNVAASAVRKAREVMKKLRGESDGKEEGSQQLATSKEARKSSYSAEMIHRLGINPAIKGGCVNVGDDAVTKRKLEALASLQKDRGAIELGHRPGKRIRSGVVVSGTAPAPSSSTPPLSSSSRLENSRNGIKHAGERSLGNAALPCPPPAHGAVSADDSDDDLEVEPPVVGDALIPSR